MLKKNLKYINHVNSLNLTYELGITPFIYLTNEEFARMHTFRGFSFNSSKEQTQPYSAKQLNINAIDWRKKGVISPVQNQLSCGCCYAFAATELVATAYRLQGLDAPVLSSQQVLDCSQEYGNSGCNGGTLGASLLYIKEKGVVSESAYPYMGKEGSCQIPSGDLYTFKEWKQLLYTDEDTIKELVSSRPVSVGIASSWSNLQVFFLRLILFLHIALSERCINWRLHRKCGPCYDYCWVR